MSTATTDRDLVALWLSGSPLPAGHRFESVFEPELVLADDDVFECERCEGTGSCGGSYHPSGCEYAHDWGPIDCEARDGGCDGHGLVHGYRGAGGMPVRIVEGGSEGPAAGPRSVVPSSTISSVGAHG